MHVVPTPEPTSPDQPAGPGYTLGLALQPHGGLALRGVNLADEDDPRSAHGLFLGPPGQPLIPVMECCRADCHHMPDLDFPELLGRAFDAARTEFARPEGRAVLGDLRERVRALNPDGARDPREWSDELVGARKAVALLAGWHVAAYASADLTAALDGADLADIEADEAARCMICRCTEDQACVGSCFWVVDPLMRGDLCSGCAPLAGAG